ncbi:MAG: polyphosphate--glucose phosphotransferase [Angustibacter sp.]
MTTADSVSADSFTLGIDIGGSGIKGAPVDLGTGALLRPRLRLATPAPATPESVMESVAQIVRHFDQELPPRPDLALGVTVPAVVQQGIVRTAANIHHSWIGFPIEQRLAELLGRPVRALNDADAAGVAEARFGAARGQSGLAIVATLGTGIGTALLLDGRLIPNSEFGHLELSGRAAELYASSAARENEELSWPQWAERLEQYFTKLENLLWPQLLVVGGGVSRKAEKFLPLITLRTAVVPAELLNQAGLIGAALWATAAEHPEG